MPPVVIRNDEWTWEEAYRYLYEDAAFDNIVISPGPGSPMCPADIGTYLAFIEFFFAFPPVFCLILTVTLSLQEYVFAFCLSVVIFRF